VVSPAPAGQQVNQPVGALMASPDYELFKLLMSQAVRPKPAERSAWWRCRAVRDAHRRKRARSAAITGRAARILARVTREGAARVRRCSATRRSAQRPACAARRAVNRQRGTSPLRPDLAMGDEYGQRPHRCDLASAVGAVLAAVSPAICARGEAQVWRAAPG